MSFATSQDIADRLAQTFTAAQTTQADLMLEQITGLISLAAGKDDEWAPALTTVPVALSSIAIEAVARAMAASPGVRSESEQLGQYQHQVSYQDGTVGAVFLTPDEERRVRRIVFGSGTASPAAVSILDDLYEFGS